MVKFVGMYFVLGAIAFPLYAIGMYIYALYISNWNQNEANDMINWVTEGDPRHGIFSNLNSEEKLYICLKGWGLWPAVILGAIMDLSKGFKEYKEHQL